MGLLLLLGGFGGVGDGGWVDRRLRDREGCLVHGGGTGGGVGIGVLRLHGRKMCIQLCNGWRLLLWHNGLVWPSSMGTSLLVRWWCTGVMYT